MPALVSQDGRWFWDGTRWRSRLVEGPLDHFWFTSTADWQQRILVTGLIGLIPIVGAINLMGWTLATTDNVRRGWKELPPAGFHYLERGGGPFVVSLLYGLVAFLVVAVVFAGGIVLVFTQKGWQVLGIALIVIAVILLVAWWLLSIFLLAAFLIGTDRLGIGRALNPATLVRLARQNFDASIHAGFIYFAAALALAVVGIAIGVIVPFGSFIISIGLPGVYAMVVPHLARFEVGGSPALPPSPPLDTRPQ